MSHQLPDGTRREDVWCTYARKDASDGSALRGKPGDAFTTSLQNSLVIGLALAGAATGMLTVLDLQVHLPAVLLGMACGVLLYALVRSVVVHWARLRSGRRTRRIAPQAVKLGSRSPALRNPSTSRSRP
jgi:hypothetical protein